VIAFQLPDELLDVIEARVRTVVREELVEHGNGVSPWLDADGAAGYAAMSVDAIKSATKRNQLRAYRSETGRVRYRREDLDAFLRGGDAA
jgi:hypothetical protein